MQYAHFLMAPFAVACLPQPHLLHCKSSAAASGGLPELPTSEQLLRRYERVARFLMESAAYTSATESDTCNENSDLIKKQRNITESLSSASCRSTPLYLEISSAAAVSAARSMQQYLEKGMATKYIERLCALVTSRFVKSNVSGLVERNICGLFQTPA